MVIVTTRFESQLGVLDQGNKRPHLYFKLSNLQFQIQAFTQNLYKDNMEGSGKKSVFSIESILSTHNNSSGNNGGTRDCNSGNESLPNDHCQHLNNSVPNLFCESPPPVVKTERISGSYIVGGSSGDESYDYTNGQEYPHSSNSNSHHNNGKRARNANNVGCSAVLECKSELRSLCSPSSASTLLIDDADSTVDMAEDAGGDADSVNFLDETHEEFRDLEDDDNEDLCQEDCRDEDDQRALSG